MIDNPMESEYVRRPDAKGHLKVMELLRKWDPIGVITDKHQDEYNRYSATIVRLLDAGISEKDLFKHMKRIVEEYMGIHCNRKLTEQIAHELVEFWKEWKPE